MKIKNLVFDMGNVLIQFQPDLYLSTWVPEPEDRALLKKQVFQSVEWIRIDHGTLTETEAVTRCCQRLPERLHGAAAKLFAEWSAISPAIPGMEALIRKAKEQGYRIYLLSNTNVRYHDFRVKLPAIDCFDGEFISADWKMLKPDLSIYQTFLTHFSLQAEQCIFVDDTPQNVYAAQRAGMEAIVFHGDAAELRQELRKYGVDLS